MAALPKVLLLGDSIRQSYEPVVCQKLSGRAEVVGPKENCQFSLYTLVSVSRWIEDMGKPEIIHWNNGLHDCGHCPGRRPIQIPPGVYIGNLEAFQSAGLLQRIPLENGSQLFELTDLNDHYHHLICRECHKTERLEVCLGEQLSKKAKTLGYSQIAHVLEVYGLCRECSCAAN